MDLRSLLNRVWVALLYRNPVFFLFVFSSWSLWFSRFGFSGAGVGDAGRKKQATVKREGGGGRRGS